MRSRKWLYNKNVVLSGCSTGMGKDMAKLLISKYNCRVFGIARNVGKLEALKAELGENFQFISCDISTKASWEKIRDAVVDANFAPDVLINNAGTIHPFIKFRNIDDAEIEKIVATNYMSIIYSTKLFLPLLEKSSQPAIINVASASAYLPVAGASVYSSTKSAALSFTEVIKEELMGEGFYVGAVMPGPVKTELYADRGNVGESHGKVKDKAFTNFGLTSEKAAKKILRRISKCKTRITIGAIAGVMSSFYRCMPSTSLKITGKSLRILPLATYKDMFVGEKEIRQARKEQYKASKNK